MRLQAEGADHESTQQAEREGCVQHVRRQVGHANQCGGHGQIEQGFDDEDRSHCHGHQAKLGRPRKRARQSSMARSINLAASREPTVHVPARLRGWPCSDVQWPTRATPLDDRAIGPMEPAARCFVDRRCSLARNRHGQAEEKRIEQSEVRCGAISKLVKNGGQTGPAHGRQQGTPLCGRPAAPFGSTGIESRTGSRTSRPAHPHCWQGRQQSWMRACRPGQRPRPLVASSACKETRVHMLRSS